MSYGENIKKLRNEKGIKQADLGKLLNVSNRTISSWEKNRTKPDMEMVNAMCDIFQCGYAELMRGEPSPHALDLSALEREIIISYRQADDGIRRSVLLLLKIEEEKNEDALYA